MFTLAMSPKYSSYKSFFYDLFPHGGDGHTGNTLNTMANQSALHESATVNVDQAAVDVVLNNPLTLARRGSHTVTFVCVLISLYICINLALVVYRLSSFHPLAKVPGPRLARATRWYQTYYEIFKGGRMTEELQRLHNIYGKHMLKKVGHVRMQNIAFLRSFCDILSLIYLPQFPPFGKLRKC